MNEKPSIIRCSRLPGYLAISLAITSAPALKAATKTWNTTSGSLSSTGSWSPSGAPATGDEAVFDGTVTPASSISTAAAGTATWGDLVWNNNTSSTFQMNTASNSDAFVRLSGAAGSTAAVAAGGATGDLIVMGTNATANTLTVSSVNLNTGTAAFRLRLDNSGNFNVVNSGATLSIQTIISENGGARTLTKTGAGQLTLGSANTFTGGVVVNAGTLAIGSSSALGTGGLSINGGTVAAITSSRTIANNVTVGGNFKLGGLGQSLTFNGTVDLGGSTRTITLDNSATVNGVISNGGLTLSGGIRTLTLNTASNTYSGATLVSSGTLLVNGALANSSSVTVSSGATLGGDGSIANAVTIDSGAFLQAGAAIANTVGSLDTGAFTLNGSYLTTITGNGVNDFLNITGAANFAGTIAPVLFGYSPVVNDAFNLADWTGTFSGTPTFDYSAATLGSGLTWDSSTFATDGTLRIIAVPEPAAALLGSLGILTLLRRRRA